MRMSPLVGAAGTLRRRAAALVMTSVVLALAGCGGGGDDPDQGPVTWTAVTTPVPAKINGGPWTLAQLAPGNPHPPAVPNKSYGYDKDFATANMGTTSIMAPFYFPSIQGSGNDLQSTRTIIRV